MVDIYRAKVVDLCAESVIIEVTGPESKIDSVVGMLKPYGILEMVRTGLVAMVRGSGYFSGLPSGEENEDGDAAAIYAKVSLSTCHCEGDSPKQSPAPG